MTLTAVLGIVALAGGLQGWLLKRTNLAERLLLVVAGFLLVYPRAAFDIVGAAMVALVVVLQLLRRTPAAQPPQATHRK